MTGLTRRHALTLTAAAAAVAGIGLDQLPAPAQPADGGGPVDQIYRGRRIHIMVPVPGRPGLMPMGPMVLIDDVHLHVMSNADGTYTPVTNHYQTYPSLLAAARAAVVELDGASLVPLTASTQEVR